MPRDSPAPSFSNPNEAALYTYCKQTLKSRLFKGFYKERCYVDAVNGYRDLVVVNRSEKDLKLALEDIVSRLFRLYMHDSPKWIGISANVNGTTDTISDISIWSEFDELAFGHYWFTIRGIRFRENEVIIKIRPVRAVEEEPAKTFASPQTADASDNILDTITLEDFIKVVIGWGTSTKKTIYDFMSNDISKDNLKSLFNFLILLVISLLSASMHAIKFIGIFTIHFMMEFRKLLVVSTPIFMRIIDLCSKVVGGFYILLAMIWRDLRGGTNPTNERPRARLYDRPKYQRITYKTQTS